MKIDPKIFKAYDIRGIYPEEINEEAARQIAKAFVKFLNAKSIVIGRDMRESSPDLLDAAIEGLLEMGVTVYDLGLASTPMVYFAPSFLGTDGSIVITPSHNPMKYNGIKFTDSTGFPIFKENGMLEIQKIADKEIETSKERGVLKKIDLTDDYVKHLKTNKFNFRKLKVVIDAMHGAIGPVVKEVFKDTELDVVFIGCDPDKNIPGYKTPNPVLRENRVNIKKAILENGADLGIMFDGDGDRTAVVDGRGELILLDYTNALVSEEVLKKEPGATIVGDVRTSRIVRDVALEHGGKFFEAEAGNPYVKFEMKKKDAAFGFEKSGHLMFRKSHFAEDPITANIMLLNALSRSDKSPQEIFDDLKSKYIIDQEINFQIKDKSILEKVAEKYKEGKISNLDGISVDFDNYRFNIRTSNTEPLIRLNMEASSAEILEEKKKEFTDFLLANGCKLE